jgi:hypothetical protein
MEYVKTGATSDSTPPPPPFNVTARARGDQGTEITWSAEADFESGIRNFIVLRDGQELAQVPEKPVGKFGRPLFQSMTYHDTPSQPLAEMRFLDASAKPGEKHTYSIITVNGVGLKSQPSVPSRLLSRAIRDLSLTPNFSWVKLKPGACPNCFNSFSLSEARTGP